MSSHALLIKLIVGYTLAGALVFTVVVTCLSLIGLVRFADQAQQNKLFTVLIVELVVVGVGFFGDLLKFNPVEVEQKIKEVEQYKSIAVGLDRFVFVTEVLQEYLEKQWTTAPSMKKAVTEYNAAILDLRSNESLNLKLLQILPEENAVENFEEIMQLVKAIDTSVHTLNDELEKVSILGVQEKIESDRAARLSAELKPMVSELRGAVERIQTVKVTK